MVVGFGVICERSFVLCTLVLLLSVCAYRRSTRLSLTGRLVPFFLEFSFACTLAFCLFGFLNPRNSIHIVSSSASKAADLRSQSSLPFLKKRRVCLHPDSTGSQFLFFR